LLGFNAIFHLFSLLLFVGCGFYILSLQKKLRLMQSIWFSGKQRLFVSPREVWLLFARCYGLDLEQVKTLTPKVPVQKKILDVSSVRRLLHASTWSIADNRLNCKLSSENISEAVSQEAAHLLGEFFGISVDIITP